MNAMLPWLDDPQMIRLGTCLLHFIWQGALVALLSGIILWMLRRAESSARYAALVVLFGLMAATPVATFVLLAETPFSANATAAAPLDRALSMNSGPSSPPTRAENLLQRLPTAAGDPAARISPLNWSSQLTRSWAWLNAQRAWLVCGWLVGVGLLSLRLLAALWGAHRIRHRQLSPVPDACNRVFQGVAVAMRLNVPIAIWKSALVEVPVVVGWLKPAILLPASMLSGIPEPELRALLAHELAHVRRHDYLLNVLQTLVETLLFYHPAVWWLSGVIRQEREQCCDDLAAAVCGDKIIVARALATVAELHARTPQSAVAANGGHVVVRIRRLIAGPTKARARSARWSAGGSLIVLAMMAAVWLTGPSLISGFDQPSGVQATSAKTAATNDVTERATVDDFQVTLPDGAKMSLNGLGEHPNLGKKWWRPDGTPVNMQIDTKSFISDEILSTTKRMTFREFLVEHQIPRDATLRLSVNAGPAWSGQGGTVYSEKEIRGSYIIPEKAESLTVTLTYSTGDWQEFATATPAGGDIRQDVKFAPLRVRDDGVWASVSHPRLTDEIRIVAIARDGTTQIGQANNRSNREKLVEDSCRFNGLPLTEIAAVRLEIRPAQLIEFRNVAVSSGKKTQVTVVVDGQALTPEPAGQNLTPDAAAKDDSAAKPAANTEKAGDVLLSEKQINDIVQQLRKNESLVKGLRVKAEAKIRQRTGLYNDGPELKREIKVDFSADEQGRLRILREGGLPGRIGTTQVYQQRSIGTFDGTLVRVLEGKVEYERGYIGPDKARLPREVDPRNYLQHFHHDLISPLLDKTYRILGRRKVNNRDLIVIESQPVVNDDVGYKAQILLDPEFDFSPISRSLWIRFAKSSAEWHEYSHTDTSDFQKSAEGIWLPGRGIYTSYNVNEKQVQEKAERTIAWQYDVTFTNWELNPQFTDRDFTLDFPDGILIHDDRNPTPAAPPGTGGKAAE